MLRVVFVGLALPWHVGEFISGEICDVSEVNMTLAVEGSTSGVVRGAGQKGVPLPWGVLISQSVSPECSGLHVQ